MATEIKGKRMNIKSVNQSLVNATTAAINATVENGEKWQKLTKKLVKKSEPIRRKQMDMVFDTAEAVKTQFSAGTEKAKDLIEFDQVMEFVSNNPVSQKVYDVTEDIKEAADGIKNTAESIKNKVSENPIVQQLSRTGENLKTKGTAKFNDIKDDVLEQAQTILNKGEKMVGDALTVKKEAKTTEKATATTTKAAPKAKASATKSTTATKATTTKRTTRAKAATKTAAKAPVAKNTTAKATPAKAETPAAKASAEK